MPSMTFSTTFLESYATDSDGVCSTCGCDAGKSNVIGCREGIKICMNCAELLGDIKKEKDAESRNKAVSLMNELWSPNSKIHCEAIYDAIYAGKIHVARLGD